MDLGINLASEAPESNYTAKVTATNKLGQASSLPSTFTFSDIGTFFYFTFSKFSFLASETL